MEHLKRQQFFTMKSNTIPVKMSLDSKYLWDDANSDVDKSFGQDYTVIYKLFYEISMFCLACYFIQDT